LNNIFVNRYSKIQCWPRNYDNLWDDLRFLPICYYSIIFGLIQKSFGLSVFGFDLPSWLKTLFYGRHEILGKTQNAHKVQGLLVFRSANDEEKKFFDVNLREEAEKKLQVKTFKKIMTSFPKSAIVIRWKGL
jgi:hypothetical protein